jgi:transcriptional regulator with GAF, ATPase, and Fis domain
MRSRASARRTRRVYDRARGQTEAELHDADIESLERTIMQLAMERTKAAHGAIFLYDPKAKGLRVDFHVVDGLIVTLPGAVLRAPREGVPKGIAFCAFERNRPYLCRDTSIDANYARYFHDVASIAAVPIPYQGRAIGVISVSTSERGGLEEGALTALEELATTSAKFLRRAQLYRQTRDDGGRPFLIKGLSPEWLEVERRMEHVAPTNAPVLIRGESGTGKDLVARAIHFNSRRASQPLVVVNCAAIPESMLESVLFGHVKGAFTGATFDKVGEFHKANGGTLFLDELGELPTALQAKVLRAVEYGEVQPLGSNHAPERVDVRLICATNRDLLAMARSGQFREDLYFRLSVMPLEVPPLRSYKADNLETMAVAFLQQAALKHGLAVDRIHTDALATLHAYDFPGNVRELKNAIEHAAILARQGEVTVSDLPPAIREARSAEPLEGGCRAERPSVPSPSKHGRGHVEGPLALRPLAEVREEWLAPLERRYLTELLESCHGNVRRAADVAGVNTVTLYRLLKKRNLKFQRRLE